MRVFYETKYILYETIQDRFRLKERNNDRSDELGSRFGDL